MGPITAFFLVAATALSTPAEEAPPTHEEIMSQGSRLVDAPSSVLAPDPVYETDDTEINCPPPTRLRCWMAADQDGGTPTVYCSCRK